MSIAVTASEANGEIGFYNMSSVVVDEPNTGVLQVRSNSCIVWNINNMLNILTLYLLSRLWDAAYKRSLAAKQKE